VFTAKYAIIATRNGGNDSLIDKEVKFGSPPNTTNATPAAAADSIICDVLKIFLGVGFL
jgi:hypothetical protein